MINKAVVLYYQCTCSDNKGIDQLCCFSTPDSAFVTHMQKAGTHDMAHDKCIYFYKQSILVHRETFATLNVEGILN